MENKLLTLLEELSTKESHDRYMSQTLTEVLAPADNRDYREGYADGLKEAMVMIRHCFPELPLV